MSKLEQLSTRPPTHIITTRIDARYLATLIMFWREQGELPKSKSELARLSLESFVEFLVLSNKVIKVQRFEDALEIIDKTGLSISKTIPRNLARALIIEGATLDFLQAPDPAHSHKQYVKENPVDETDIEVAKAILESKEEADLNSRIAEAKSRSTDFKKNLGIRPATQEDEE